MQEGFTFHLPTKFLSFYRASQKTETGKKTLELQMKQICKILMWCFFNSFSILWPRHSVFIQGAYMKCKDVGKSFMFSGATIYCVIWCRKWNIDCRHCNAINGTEKEQWTLCHTIIKQNNLRLSRLLNTKFNCFHWKANISYDFVSEGSLLDLSSFNFVSSLYISHWTPARRQ